MPSSLARLTDLQHRKESLAATAAAQRLQLVQELASAGNAARDHVRHHVARARSWGRAASVALGLMAALAAARRSRRTRHAPRVEPPPKAADPVRTSQPTSLSLLTQALPILRVLLATWLEQRASRPRRSP